MNTFAALAPVTDSAHRLMEERAQGDAADEIGRCTRWTEDAEGRRIGVSAFQFSGLHCAACAGVIEAALGRLSGVTQVQVNGSARRGQLHWNPALLPARELAERVKRAAKAAGYGAAPDLPEAADQLRRSERRQALWRTAVAGFCAMQVMMFATPSYVATGAELAPDLRQLLNWGSWLVSLPVLLFSAGPFFRSAWQALRRRQITMEVPVALGVAVTFLASTGATFDPTGPWGTGVYFDSFTMFVSFLLLGRYVEMSARHRAAEALEQSSHLAPSHAQRLLGAGLDAAAESVAFAALRPGDLLRVARGEAFPADGRLQSAAAEVDEALLTGESRAVAKLRGDLVYAGSLNLQAPVVMCAERVGQETRHQAIVALMQGALCERPALVRQADAWAGPFLWAVLFLAGGGAALWSVIDPSRAVWVAVSVLIVTCPCALSLSVPSALVSAAGAMARHGVLWRHLDALQAFAGMNHLFADKTGTLTEETPACVGMVRLNGQAAESCNTDDEINGDGLWAAAAGLAHWSAHPLSRALVASAAAHRSGTQPWTDIQEMPGHGVQARDAQGRLWRLGARDWVQLDGLEQACTVDSTSVWCGPDGLAWARFDFDEQLRPDAAAAVAELVAAGVQVTVLSGDRPERVARLQRALPGADTGQGGASPEQKLAAVAVAQARGEVVGMVGDGINDAPVLARADVAFAMGHSGLLTKTQADAVITSGRWADLVWARDRARLTLRVIRQNLLWALAYNAACVPLALGGFLPPWAAGLGMACSSLFVVANSGRLSRFSRPAD